jgi:hypothetical protein
MGSITGGMNKMFKEKSTKTRYYQTIPQFSTKNSKPLYDFIILHHKNIKLGGIKYETF